MITRINIDATKIDTQERKNKLEIVAQEMHSILNSTIFRDKVLAFNKYGETSKWKNKTNMEVYKHIMSGSETLSPAKDNVMNIYVDDYYSLKRVIGYTYANRKTQYVNTRYFDVRTTKLIGSNIIHEYGHKLGFGHDFRSTSRRNNSICYLLNKAYEEAYDRIIGQKPVHNTKRVCSRSWKTLWLKKTCWYVNI